jgi:hypothetical protein
VPLPDDCPVCHADLAHLNVPGPEGRPERVDCMGREQHLWLVVNQGTPERPNYDGRSWRSARTASEAPAKGVAHAGAAKARRDRRLLLGAGRVRLDLAHLHTWRRDQHPRSCELYKHRHRRPHLIGVRMTRLRWHHRGERTHASGRGERVHGSKHWRLRVVAYRKRHLGTSSWWYARVKGKGPGKPIILRTGLSD